MLTATLKITQQLSDQQISALKSCHESINITFDSKTQNLHITDPNCNTTIGLSNLFGILLGIDLKYKIQNLQMNYSPEQKKE